MNALMQAQRDVENFDFSTAVFDALKKVTDHNFGPFEPSSWLCINLDTNQVGRAYPYKGEHRIVAITPDFGMMEEIDQAMVPDEG